jgi:hypothetical protein
MQLKDQFCGDGTQYDVDLIRNKGFVSLEKITQGMSVSTTICPFDCGNYSPVAQCWDEEGIDLRR